MPQFRTHTHKFQPPSWVKQLLLGLFFCLLSRHAYAQVTAYNVTEISFFDTPPVYSSAEKDGRLLLGTQSGLHVVDVSNVATPLTVATLPTLTPIVDMQRVGNLLVVSRSLGGVSMVDVADPAQPTLLDTYAVPSGANDAFLDEDQLYIAGGVPGTVDASTGNLILSGSGLGGLRVVDASNPAALTEIGRYLYIPGFSVNVAAANDVVYVNNTGGSLFVLDVSTPSDPQLITEVSGVGSASDMTLDGDRLYMAGGTAMLQIYDIANPANPTLLSTLSDPDGGNSASAVAVSGGVAYVSAEWYGLRLYDVSNGAAPAYLAGYDPTFQPSCAVPVGQTVYLCGGNNRGVMIVDVDDGSPPFVGTEHVYLPVITR